MKQNVQGHIPLLLWRLVTRLLEGGEFLQKESFTGQEKKKGGIQKVKAEVSASKFNMLEEKTMVFSLQWLTVICNVNFYHLKE